MLTVTGPLTLGGVARYLPARPAATVDPGVPLRSE